MPLSKRATRSSNLRRPCALLLGLGLIGCGTAQPVAPPLPAETTPSAPPPALTPDAAVTRYVLMQFNGRSLPVDLGPFSLWGPRGVYTMPVAICRRLLTEGDLRLDTTARFALELRDRSGCTDQELARRRLSGVYGSMGDEVMLVIPNAPAPYNQLSAVRRGDELDVRFVDDYYCFRLDDSAP